jgi:hypothetical protein
MPLLFSTVYSTTLLLQLQSFFLFRGHVVSALPPLSGGVCHTLAAVTSLPLSKYTGRGGVTPAFSGRLVYSQFHERVPLPHAPELRVPHFLYYVSFFFSAACLLLSLVFSLFFLGGGQSV